MKLVRVKKDNELFFGILEEGRIKRISGISAEYPCFQSVGQLPDFFNSEITEVISETACKQLYPIMPSKIVAVGKNYHAHAMEMNEGEPTEPLLFLKPNTCIIGENDFIVYPSQSKRVDYEGELGVVIKKVCKNVSENDALDYVFGYTCLNDVTARDIQKSDPQWTRGKSFDTFCPIGPCIETELAVDNTNISTTLNGVRVQSSNTKFMTHSVKKLIAYISSAMTLLPGDIIATGTPEGIGSMQLGDSVCVTIEGIGCLTNTVIK